jgi:DNA-binding transcriptional MerR regulator
MTPPKQPNAAPQEEPELIGIREMCAAYGVTARTLRFYEAKELLSPRRVGQSRLFTRRDRARLKLILRGKRFGFALEEIRELLDLYDRDDRHLVQLRKTYALARDRLAEMEARRAELDEAIHDLRAELDWGAQVLAEAGDKAPPRA